jgi:hypothetical protein
MARPRRNANPSQMLSPSRMFFVSTKTRGFSEVQVYDRQSLLRYQEYIAQNPVKAGLVDSPEKYPYCFTYLARRKGAGAKAR